MAKAKPTKMLAILGRCRRAGRWRVGGRVGILTLLGRCYLDMSDAIIDEGRLRMKVTVVFGAATFIVPDGAEVRPSGMAFLASSSVDVPPDDPRSDLPTIEMEWTCLFGRLRIITPTSAIGDEELDELADGEDGQAGTRRGRAGGNRVRATDTAAVEADATGEADGDEGDAPVGIGFDDLPSGAGVGFDDLGASDAEPGVGFGDLPTAPGVGFDDLDDSNAVVGIGFGDLPAADGADEADDAGDTAVADDDDEPLIGAPSGATDAFIDDTPAGETDDAPASDDDDDDEPLIGAPSGTTDAFIDDTADTADTADSADTAGGAAPEVTADELAALDSALPDSALPDSALPDSAVSEDALPDADEPEVRDIGFVDLVGTAR